MARKLLLSMAVFVALGFAAVAVWVKGKPKAQSINPLQGVDVQKITKIMIDRPSETITLEKKEGRWDITSPAQDWTDPMLVERWIEVLQNFSVGSVISENKDRYSQFDIEDGKASRIRVFLEGQEKPALDGYIGKQAAGFSDSYFRFEGKPAVHIASELPNYMIIRESNDYRLKKLLFPVLTDLTLVKITSGKIDVEISRSSETWTNQKNQQPVDQAWIATLVSRLDSLYIMDFGKGDEDPKTFGFDAPFAQIAVEKSGTKLSSKIGNVVPNADKNAPKKRYAQTEGRGVTLILSSQSVDDLLSHLKTLK